jgi:uncharacterized protein YqeY
MALKGGIQDAMKSAMKQGDRVAVDTLRLLLSVLHNEEIKARRTLTDDEVQKAIATLCKQRLESIELFKKGGRDDLVSKEEAELSILRRFLPQPLSEDEIRALIRSSISEVGANGAGDLGRVMKQVMPKVSGRSDGRRVNELVREMLGA